MSSGIFLSIKDLMFLTGSNNYKSCAKAHHAIRDALAANKRKLTIKEYCDFEKLNLEEILQEIRKIHK
jgi:protein-disulfide isomerase